LNEGLSVKEHFRVLFALRNDRPFKEETWAMSTDPNFESLLAQFLHPANAAAGVDSARPVASTGGDQVEKTAASRGTAREVIEAKPDNLRIPSAPNTTTGEKSGGQSSE
jgi:hypothetical protein